MAEFESAIVSALAWANQIPPEIVQLAFSNNYSASQAAINEFKIYLNLVWGVWGDSFCSPIYLEHMVSDVIAGKTFAPGLIESLRDPFKYDVLAAWSSVEWYGNIKPSTDMLKQANASKILVREGWSTNAREARVLTGTKWSKNMKRIARENQIKAEALRPMLELRQEFGEFEVDEVLTSTLNDLSLQVEELQNDRG